MEITVNRSEFLRELSTANAVVERKTTIPILSTFLFEAKDGTLHLTGTDLDRSLRTSCGAKVKQGGDCTIPARKLLDYVKLLPEGDIKLKLQDNSWVAISAGKSRTKMVGMDRANYPQVPAFPTQDVLHLSASALRSMLSRVVFSISGEESRYSIAGALLILKPESVAMCATDGHRLAYVQRLGESLHNLSSERRVLIPLKAVVELTSLLADRTAADEAADDLEFAETDTTLFFRTGGRTMTTQRLTRQFPNFEAVLPRDNSKYAIVRTSDLLASLQRVSQFADERSGAVKVTLADNKLTIRSSSTEVGESEDEIETPYSHEPLTIAFNGSYLIDFLKVCNAPEVRLSLKDTRSAGEITPEDGSDELKYRYVVMPMNI